MVKVTFCDFGRPVPGTQPEDLLEGQTAAHNQEDTDLFWVMTLKSQMSLGVKRPYDPGTL